MKTFFSLFLLCFVQLAAAAELADPKLRDPSLLQPPWSKETIAAWERVPIRDGGRVKPLYTFAYYELLRTRGMASLTIPLTGKDPATGKDSRRLSPMEWLLDCLFYPETAKEYACFTVDDGEALLRVGMTAHGAKRDQYSYNELVLGRDKLAMAQKRVDDEKERAKNANIDPSLDYLDEMAANLARNVGAFETLIQAFAPLRRQISIASTIPDGLLSDKKGGKLSTAEAIEHLKGNPMWKQLSDALAAQGSTDPAESMMQVLSMLKQSESWEKYSSKDFRQMGQFGPAIEAWMTENQATLNSRPGLAAVANLSPYLLLDMSGGSRVAILPPHGGESTVWHAVGELPKLALGSDAVSAQSIEMLKKGEQIFAATDSAAFQQSVLKFGQDLVQVGASQPTASKVGSELLFRKANLLGNAKVLFILIFMMVAISWLAPNAPWSAKLFLAAKWLAWLPMLAILITICWRVYLSGWAPVTNLYETIPMITLVAAGLALFAEKMFKNRLALGLGAAMGGAGMFLAGAFEASEAADTIQTLEAVLRSGFWLWTHVMCEAIGYAGCVAGGAFSIVYIFARLFDLDRKKAQFFKMLTTCAYGILCFTLFFILVGTVLGGIWGNYSWGRFWGWDPKENGALIITLWCLAVLHMRLAGWIKEFGLHLMSVLGMNAVIFSWWHVNELSVGLHAYGKSEGRMKYIIAGYCVVLAIVVFGAIISWLAKNNKKPAPPRAQKLTDLQAAKA